MIVTIVIVFVIFAVLGMPLAYALGLAGLAGIFVGGFPVVQLSGKMVHSLDSFPFLSIPLFMLAGQLMLRGGIMERLIDWANAIIGRVQGGLGHVTVLAAMGLSAGSGRPGGGATAPRGAPRPALGEAAGRP